MNTNELYWVAGIIEGEGCFSISYAKTNPRITIEVGMNDKDIIYKLQKVTNLGSIAYYSRIKHYKWRVAKQQDVAALMMMLYSLMGERRRARIKSCLEEWRSFPYRRQRPCSKGHDASEKLNSSNKCRICNKERAAKRRFKIKYLDS